MLSLEFMIGLEMVKWVMPKGWSLDRRILVHFIQGTETFQEHKVSLGQWVKIQEK